MSSGISITPVLSLGRWSRPLCALVLLATAACSGVPVAPSGSPAIGPALVDRPFLAHARTEEDEYLRVTVSVLSNDEARQALGVDLESRWIQALWIEVENRDLHPYWLLMPSLDPNYFAPDEVAYALRLPSAGDATEDLMDRLRHLAFRNPVTPGTATSGFVFVSMDLDAKQIDVQLLSADRLAEFVFFLPVRGVNAATLFDVEQARAGKAAVDVDEQTLRNTLGVYPCCTSNEDGSGEGDPLNLVLIGNAEDLFPAFVRRGWHAAETTYSGSIRRTIGSFLFGQRYIYSPVSPLYAFGRPHDIAFQKSRGTIHQRNHLRLWLTPMRYDGKGVWIGQISRDIGVKLTAKSPFLFTHVIDPDVDEARNGLIQDLLFSQGLVKIGYVRGAPAASEALARTNLTDDAYFSDGLRAVMLIDQSPRPIREVDFFTWDRPPPHTRARQLDLTADYP